jgi:hypothetical protein
MSDEMYGYKLWSFAIVRARGVPSKWNTSPFFMFFWWNVFFILFLKA